MRELGRSPFREGGALRLCLVYPNTPEVGACNLGFATVFRLANEARECSAERAFALPSRGGAASGPPRSLETQRPLDEFAVIAFSCMSELDYLNVARFLESAGIPWRRQQRGPQHPVVLAGGAAPTLNPAPLLPLADVVVRGEAESGLTPLLEALARGFVAGGRDGLLGAARSAAGAGSGAGSDAAVLTLRPPPDPMACLDLVPEDGVFAGMALVEAARGCPWTCRFCSARVLYQPFRVVPAERLLAYAARVRPLTSRLGLVGAGLAARDDLVPLLDAVERLGMTASLSSLRVDGLTPDLVERLLRHGQRTVTVAPESFRPATLEVLGKRPPSDGWPGRLRTVLGGGVERLKVYMMAGIPGDVPEEGVAAAEEALGALGRLARRVQLSYSVFQPKPGTPWADEALAEPTALRRELRLVKKRLGRIVGNLELPGERGVRLADLLCRGGPDALELALAGRVEAEDHEASLRSGRPFWLDASPSCPGAPAPKG